MMNFSKRITQPSNQCNVFERVRDVTVQFDMESNKSAAVKLLLIWGMCGAARRVGFIN